MATHANIDGLDDLERKLQEIIDKQSKITGVKVGVVETAKYPLVTMKGRPKRKTAPTVAQVAFWNEFGTKGGGWGGPIPSRPFMRQSALKYRKDEKVNLMLRHAFQFSQLDNLERNSNLLGVILKGIMQEEMTDGNFKPNSPTTIAIKTNQGPTGGTTTPLIDTQLLRSTINYEVVKSKDKQPEKSSHSSQVFVRIQ